MDDKDVQKMWDISQKLEMGQFVAADEQKFFNANLDKMRQKTEEDYDYWTTVEKTHITYY